MPAQDQSRGDELRRRVPLDRFCLTSYPLSLKPRQIHQKPIQAADDGPPTNHRTQRCIRRSSWGHRFSTGYAKMETKREGAPRATRQAPITLHLHLCSTTTAEWMRRYHSPPHDARSANRSPSAVMMLYGRSPQPILATRRRQTPPRQLHCVAFLLLPPRTLPSTVQPELFHAPQGVTSTASSRLRPHHTTAPRRPQHAPPSREESSDGPPIPCPARRRVAWGRFPSAPPDT
ncbi:hypothetical protein C8R45DRAFT_364124 [Mycena sanguinolenta]|nr:hypothetical protein C8R45DRAFT_364124 [Mycena sanguinolenta]